MERKILQPEQIIVPGEYELGNESILKIYFRVFDREHDKDLPPVIVTHKSKINPSYLSDSYSDKQKADEFYQMLMDSEAQYLLLDGNHKSVAATLCHIPIHSLNLERRTDIAKVRKMVKHEELFDFPHKQDSLIEIANSFIQYIYRNKEIIMTVRQRVDKLTSNGDLPQYMKERYHKGK